MPEGQRWAHLDIAGPAFNEAEPHGYTPKGGTGAAVRTLVQLAEDVAAGALYAATAGPAECPPTGLPTARLPPASRN